MYRNSFTTKEALEIKELLRKKCSAQSNEQKECRRILRNKYNFFINFFGGFKPIGMTTEDFDSLV